MLEGDNVLKQVIIPKDGRVAYFRRDFGEKEAKMVRFINKKNIKPLTHLIKFVMHKTFKVHW